MRIKPLTLFVRSSLVIALWLGGVYALHNVDSIKPFFFAVKDQTTTIADDTKELSIEWPTDGAHIDNMQAFKASLSNATSSEYIMFWQVDDDRYNQMTTLSASGGMEAPVDLSGWNWKGEGPYRVTFIAQTPTGFELSKKSIQIYRALATSATSSDIVVAGTSSASTDVQTAATLLAGNTSIAFASAATVPTESPVIDVWWPTEGSHVSGVQPLKAVLKGKTIYDYVMTWKTGDGNPTQLIDTVTDTPHKEIPIDFTGWTWKGAGPYVIHLVARTQNGDVLAEKDLTIYTGEGANAPVQVATETQSVTKTIEPAVVAVPAPSTETQTAQKAETKPQTSLRKITSDTAIPTVTPTVSQGTKLYVPPNNAFNQANEWRSTRPADATLMDKVGFSSQGIWFGGWNNDIRSDVSKAVTDASAQNAVPVLVAYNIPGRDCGSYSAGGATNAGEYRSWISSFADGLGDKPAIIVLEPDGLSTMDCLSYIDQAIRLSLLSDAVSILKAHKGAKVYIDAGHAKWLSTDTITDRLKKSGIGKADGFALNVSNFIKTSDNVAYGEIVSRNVGGKHFVVDTGRNGNGPTSNSEWCNPTGRALGEAPTTSTGNSAVDAYLWIKRPGESDGECNGGPRAGAWWPDYALNLSRNAHY